MKRNNISFILRESMFTHANISPFIHICIFDTFFIYYNH